MLDPFNVRELGFLGRRLLRVLDFKGSLVLGEQFFLNFSGGIFYEH